MTTPIAGCVWSTPPIVYALVVMFVCGGFSTWRSVWLGEVKRVRILRSDAGRHFANAARLRTAEAAAPTAASEAVAAAALARRRRRPVLGRLRGEARLHLRELRCRRTRDVALHVERLRRGLQRRDDLRDDAFLVLGEERQALRHLRDAGDRGDLLRRGLLERQLRPGQEEVVDEVRARLSELREVGDHRLVRLDQVAVCSAAARPALKAARVLLLRRERHRQVGADAGERVECLLLRLVEAARDTCDHDDERDPEPETERGENVRARRRTSSFRR